MSDFRKPTDPYLEQELESERVKREEQFYGKFVRPTESGQMHPQVEAEGSWINNPRNRKK